MNKIEHHGWSDSIKIENEKVELIASTQFGPRILHVGFVGGKNLLHADPEWHGKVGPIDKWVNYGGHRIWFAPEVHPLTYGPDNSPVERAEYEGDELVLTSQVEPHSGIQKELRVEIASAGAAAVKVTHLLTNHNAWPIELAPWALSVVAEGGRVVLPQEPYKGHGEDNEFLPSRPLVLWPFTDMSDSRWTWGKKLIHLRSDPALDTPQKIGIFNTLGWGAYIASNGDVLVKILDVDDYAPEEYPDYGSTFETFTKGAFQEIETLGPLELIEPGDTIEFIEYWYLAHLDEVPSGDAELSATLEPLIAEARKELGIFGIGVDY
jgi:hypothetical protein